jgi:CheY-like chemotaxis protein
MPSAAGGSGRIFLAGFRKRMSVKPINVLLIEDNSDDVVLIRISLSQALKVPYELKHADRLRDGLELLGSEKIDVVLLDLGLPDGQGLATFKKVRAHSPDVPIIVLTGHDDDDFALEAVQKGAQDYLVKGKVEPVLLGRSIRYAIERQKLLTQLEHSTKEIKILRGFLPICAGCKKIRDDTGYWTQIETYISEHSEAEFSHGLCPDCLLKFYGPRLAKKSGDRS